MLVNLANTAFRIVARVILLGQKSCHSCAQNPFMNNCPTHPPPPLANTSSLNTFSDIKPDLKQVGTVLPRRRCPSVCPVAPPWYCSVNPGATLAKIAVALIFVWLTVVTAARDINLLVICIHPSQRDSKAAWSALICSGLDFFLIFSVSAGLSG